MKKYDLIVQEVECFDKEEENTVKARMTCAKDRFGEPFVILYSVVGIEVEIVQNFAQESKAIWDDPETDQVFIRVQLPGDDHARLYEIKAFALVLRGAQERLTQKELA